MVQESIEVNGASPDVDSTQVEGGPSNVQVTAEKAEVSGTNGEDDSNLEKAHGLLVLLRHGQSMWNRQPDQPKALWRYAGSNDVALSETGIHEALEAGTRLKNIPIDIVFSSNLSRATMTAMIALTKHYSGLTPTVASRTGSVVDGMKNVTSLPENTVIPIICSDQLNERHFGELQGMPSTEHKVRFTKEFLSKVRNDYSTRFPGEGGESTEDVYNRIVPYYDENILPLLKQGKNVLVVSHGFAIRALIKHLDEMNLEEFNQEMKKEKSDPENCKLLAATGVPLLYRYDHMTSTNLPEKIGAIDRDWELHQTCAPY